MSDGKNNDKPVQNSLLSGASGNYLFDDFISATILPVVEQNIIPVTEDGIPEGEIETEIDLNSDEPRTVPSYSHFIPQDIPHVSSAMFQSPPTPSSVQLFTQDHGQFTTPTQAINSPVISSDSYSSVGTSSSRQFFVPADPSLIPDVEQNENSDNGSVGAESVSALSHIKTTFANLVSSLAGGYSWSGTNETDTNPMNLQRTNTSTTAGTGNSEITNTVPSSYVSDGYRRVPDAFGALQTPPLIQPGSSNAASNNFRLSSQKPVYAQYPGLINSPPTSCASANTLLTSMSVEPIALLPPSSPNPAYVTAYSTVNELGSAFSFGAPVPVLAYGADNRPILQPLTYHWFYRKDADGRLAWRPFSLNDSVALEEAYTSQSESPVATDGGRHDVFVNERLRKSVYWDEDPSEVRRCSWFYKGPMDSRFIPYDEEFSSRLEEEYYNVFHSGIWHKRLEFSDGEAIVFHSAGVIVHFCKAAAPDEWGSVPESQLRPRVVKRGVCEEFEIQDGESSRIDHLVFLVHGIGAICDFKFRCIDEAVDGFRGLAFSLMQTHFKEATEAGLAGRIEFLPVSWHKALHGDRGVDEQLKKLTLPSIPKLRHFTNDTLLDILFYTSPKYCQTVIKAVGSEMNKMYNLFVSRNKHFNGQVAVGGHSLGSLILFDLLFHQPGPDTKNTIVNHIPSTESVGPTPSQINVMPSNSSIDNIALKTSEVLIPQPGSTPKMVSFSLGAAGTGQPFIVYPILDFKPTAFFALGSPTAMFVTVRGLEKLGEDFHLPTCPSYFNIFHPYDPVAYRIEPLIVEDFDPDPVLIPHHKGRKRLHLELKDTMIRVGMDLKTKLVDSVMYTFSTLSPFGKKAEPPTAEADHAPEVKAEVQKPINKEGCSSRLNKGRRIDYVLQEAPVESINEYLFALSSHVCYWESEDTMLMILKEIYNGLGVREDATTASGTSIQNGAIHGTESEPYIGPAAKVLMKDQSCTQSSAPPMESFISSGTDLGPPSITGPALQMYIPQSPPVSYQSHSQTQTSGIPLSLSVSSPSLIPTSPSTSATSTPNSGYAMGMDPTAPPSNSSIGPPPLAGFQRRT